MSENENERGLSELPETIKGVFHSSKGESGEGVERLSFKEVAVIGLRLLIVLAVLLLIAAVIFVVSLTSGELPENQNPSEPITFGDNVDTSGLPLKIGLAVNSGNTNYLLDIGRENINKTIGGAKYSGVEIVGITDMYADIGETSGILYAHIDAKVIGIKITIPLRLNFRVGLEKDSAVFFYDSCKAGSVPVPFAVIKKAVDNGNFPPEFSASSKKIFYDLSGINDIIHQMITDSREDIVGSFNKAVDEAFDKIDDDNFFISAGEKLLGFFGVDVDLKQALNDFVNQGVDKAANAVIDNVFDKTDVKISKLAIQEGQIVVEANFVPRAADDEPAE
ncbi:MAG: hypothetical protein FWE86_01340 [Oscillospiraceae bacterium]|nr:hypothetical protein [Oscillospiraceae bacterium]